MDQLDVYRINFNSLFEPKEILSRAFMASKFRDIETIGWTTCKMVAKVLYCLDRDTGLYSFDPNYLQSSVKRVTKREGCFDFFVWPK